MNHKLQDWGEALNGAVDGTVTVEDAARFAYDNGISIEYYEPSEKTYRIYYRIMEVYNKLESQQPRKNSNVNVINGCEIPGYMPHENVDDGPTGLGI